MSAHLEYLRRYPSLYSSANNHRIVELAGLVVGGSYFAEIDGARARGEDALADLVVELDRQVLPDGASAELSPAYGAFVLEVGLVVLSFLKRSGRTAPQPLIDATGRLADWIGVLATDSFTLPALSDDDEAVAVDLGQGDGSRRTASRLRSAAALLASPRQRVPVGVDELTLWLAGPDAVRQLSLAPAVLPASAVFPCAGLAVLRSRSAGVGEMRVVLDAGPFGLGPLFAHAHADLLSVCLAVDGVEVIVDPGPLTYFGDSDVRRLAQSTRSHSTVAIDDRDQAQPSGRFMWLDHPDATLTGFSHDGDTVSAAGVHSAYHPVVHHRTVALSGADVVVRDRIVGLEPNQAARLTWQLAPGTATVVSDRLVVWTGDRRRVHLHVSGARIETTAPLGEPLETTGLVTMSLGSWKPAPRVVAVATSDGQERIIETRISAEIMRAR